VDLDLYETIKLWRPQKVNPLSEVFNKINNGLYSKKTQYFLATDEGKLPSCKAYCGKQLVV
jgi:hypothetical protein